MAKTMLKEKTNDEVVESILDGIAGYGPFRVGEMWWLRTVTFHSIGRIRKIHVMAEGRYVGIELEDAVLVLQAGDSADATQQILEGKKKPASYERGPDGMVVWLHSITEQYPWKNGTLR